MGPGIIIPVLLVAVVVPVAFVWARRRFKEHGEFGGESPTAPAVRLTSNALRTLASPPWRVVYEIAADRLDGVEHVLIGPSGVFAVETSMEPLPEPIADADPHAVAAAAIMRGALDDALRRCAMVSDRLVRIQWGANTAGAPVSVELMPGVTAVDGRRITEWARAATTGHDGPPLSPAQVDLAWQTVLTSIAAPTRWRERYLKRSRLGSRITEARPASSSASHG